MVERGDPWREMRLRMCSKCKSMVHKMRGKPKLIGLGVWITAYVVGAMGWQAWAKRRSGRSKGVAGDA